MEEFVVLVNEQDEETGIMEKMEAHKKGVLHRAFSVFIFNDLGELLLQQRAFHKYHSPGLWTNTCCSHQRPGEKSDTAAHRRLQEEMGFDCELREVFSFIYKTPFENGLTEHEYDHVFLGDYNGKVNFNTDEVEAVRWIKPDDLKKEVNQSPGQFTSWFKICFEELLKNYQQLHP